MSLLNDIRSQPPHIREIFMWLCVVITFSIVSFFWLKAEAHDVVAIINPQEQTNTPAFASNSNKQNNSLFGNLGNSVGDLKANLFDLLGLTKSTSPVVTGQSVVQPSVAPQLFPAAKDK